MRNACSRGCDGGTDQHFVGHHATYPPEVGTGSPCGKKKWNASTFEWGAAAAKVFDEFSDAGGAGVEVQGWRCSGGSAAVEVDQRIFLPTYLACWEPRLD